MNRSFNDKVISDDIERIDFEKVAAWLAASYWVPGITSPEVEKAARNSSLVVGVYDAKSAQVGFARIVSDKTRFAYWMDVFVDPACRNQGIALAMIRFGMNHPDFATVYQWLLATRDAHPVYEKAGFKPLAYPERWMNLDSRKEKI